MRHLVVIIALVLPALVPLPCSGVAQDSSDVLRGRALLGDRIDWPMYDDPPLRMPQSVTVHEPRLTELWVAALARPEASVQIRAAMAIAEAQRQGIPLLPDKTGPSLIRILSRSDGNLAVRIAAAMTAIELDLTQAAEHLLARNQADGLETILLTDPALARWDYKPARVVWLARLADASGRARMSAIDALGEVGEPKAADLLRQIAVDRSAASTLRYAAAGALGKIVETGLVDTARSLAGNGAGLTDRLVAAAMLGSHNDIPAQALLLSLADDEEPAIAAVAVRRLLAIDPMLLGPRLERLCRSKDAGLRSLAVEALRWPATPRAVALLADLLADVNPSVHVAARKQMREYDKNPTLTQHVRKDAMRVLNGHAWQGLVESAHLLATLDHKPAAPRLVDILTFQRAEVRLMAIIGLRRLAVMQTMRGLLEYCRGRADRWTSGEAAPDELAGFAGELQQAFQAFGALDYRQADQFMRRFVHRKGSPFEMQAHTRAAAVWALARLHRGDQDSTLGAMFAARLNDMAPMDSEQEVVRSHAAVGIGRINSTEQMETLRKWAVVSDPGNLAAMACRWAINRITGEPIVPFKRPRDSSAGWFLEPVSPP